MEGGHGGRARTHTHKALCEHKTLEEGDVGQVIYFWPQRGLPSETPGHRGQAREVEGGVSGRRRDSAIRMMKCGRMFPLTLRTVAVSSSAAAATSDVPHHLPTTESLLYIC